MSTRLTKYLLRHIFFVECRKNERQAYQVDRTELSPEYILNIGDEKQQPEQQVGAAGDYVQ
jgi:hypothetical protein